MDHTVRKKNITKYLKSTPQKEKNEQGNGNYFQAEITGKDENLDKSKDKNETNKNEETQ